MTMHHAIRHVQYNLSQVSFSFIKPCLHDATKLVKLVGTTFIGVASCVYTMRPVGTTSTQLGKSVMYDVLM